MKALTYVIFKETLIMELQYASVCGAAKRLNKNHRTDQILHRIRYRHQQRDDF